MSIDERRTDMSRLLVDFERLRRERSVVRACWDLLDSLPSAASESSDGQLSLAMADRLERIDAASGAIARRLRADHGISDPDAAIDAGRLARRARSAATDESASVS
jgi:hypothetical protein